MKGESYDLDWASLRATSYNEWTLHLLPPRPVQILTAGCLRVRRLRRNLQGIMYCSSITIN